MLSRTDKTVTIAAAVAIVKLAVASVFVTASVAVSYHIFLPILKMEGGF